MKTILKWAYVVAPINYNNDATQVYETFPHTTKGLYAAKLCTLSNNTLADPMAVFSVEHTKDDCTSSLIWEPIRSDSIGDIHRAKLKQKVREEGLLRVIDNICSKEIKTLYQSALVKLFVEFMSEQISEEDEKMLTECILDLLDDYLCKPLKKSEDKL